MEVNIGSVQHADLNAITEIPFSFFVSLIREISKISPHKSNPGSRVLTSSSKSQRAKTLAILKRWVAELRRRFHPFPPATATHFFRFLFPEEDIRRKYAVQEARLANYLADILGVSTAANSRGECLRRWASESSIGCLGEEVKTLLDSTSSDADGRIGTLSMHRVDGLLDELASMSAFSHSSLRCGSKEIRRSRKEILCDLFSDMPPLDAAVLAQIILKDLQPLLYPLTETHTTNALLQFNCKAVQHITKMDAMRVWDDSGRMLRSHRVRASLDDVTRFFDEASSPVIKPVVGIPITIPTSSKGRSCALALSLLSVGDVERVWAETKYDGERMQIHLQVDALGIPSVQIFSKSLRDSTLDRKATHWIVKAALGFSCEETPLHPNTSHCPPLTNVILDAEMVPYSDIMRRIDEFWRIRSLIESTADGPRGRHWIKDTAMLGAEAETQYSMISDASDKAERHLAIVFFDVLFLNNTSLLDEPYSSRRQTLESVITRIPGYAILAQRTPIETRLGRVDAERQLRQTFAQAISDHQEGLVLKGESSRYNDWNCPWVKLKRDYVPGFGDTIDMVLLGAKWDKSRGRELRVTSHTMTTFYAGLLINAAECRANPTVRPHFFIYFVVSYGLSRQQLEEANFWIKNLSCSPSKLTASSELPYTYQLLPGLDVPTLFFETPILSELMGAGFTKAPRSRHYELRFPRITKFFRTEERSWRDALDADSLHKVARETVGRDRSNKDVDDWVNALWQKTSSPGVKDPKKRTLAQRQWEERLAVVDVPKRRKTVHSGSRLLPSSIPSPRQSPSRQDGENIERSHLDDAKVSKNAGRVRPDHELRRFGSITNALSPAPQASHSYEESSALVSLTVEGFSISRANSSTPNRSEFQLPRCLLPSAKNEACQASKEYSASHTCPHTPVAVAISTHGFQSSTTEAQAPSNYYNTPIAQFLSSAHLKSILSDYQVRQYYSLEAFLLACENVASADYGVVFVDDSFCDGRLWKADVLAKLRETQIALRKALSLRKEPRAQPKPIWVFDMQELSYEALERKVKDHQRRGALFRLV